MNPIVLSYLGVITALCHLSLRGLEAYNALWPSISHVLMLGDVRWSQLMRGTHAECGSRLLSTAELHEGAGNDM